MQNDVIDIRIIGSILGLIGVILMGMFWTLAVIVDGNWVFGEETLSRLADEGRPGGSFFNFAVIQMGMCMIVLTAAIKKYLNIDIFTKAGYIMMTTGSLCLIGVGIFPITTGAMHYICAISCFVLVGLAILLYCVSLLIKWFKGPVMFPYVIILLSCGLFTIIYIILLTSMATQYMSFGLSEGLMVIEMMIWCFVISVTIFVSSLRSNYSPLEIP
jgi:hypothetical membrane protein